MCFSLLKGEIYPIKEYFKVLSCVTSPWHYNQNNEYIYFFLSLTNCDFGFFFFFGVRAIAAGWLYRENLILRNVKLYGRSMLKEGNSTMYFKIWKSEHLRCVKINITC